MRQFARTYSFVLLSSTLFGQTAPRFDIADVHPSAKSQTQFARTAPVRNGRYEIKTAAMLDLIRLAWAFDADRILGGPSWLELDRFDVIAKVPADTTPDAQRLMLQSLLKERFKLTLHEDTKPVPTWTLTVGKKPQLKEADGSGDTGCKLQPASGAPGDGPRITLTNNGTPTTLNLGPGMTLQYLCRNMTMTAFAEGLRGMLGAQLNTPVLDQTGLKGMWNFDVKWSLSLMGPLAGGGERISVVDALDKQLGLKLEEVGVPKPVLVVESVNRKPTENPPGLAEALPPIPAPTEFEVADVKLAAPGMQQQMRMQMQPGGRFIVQGLPLRLVLGRAFNTNNTDQVAGVPSFADTVRVDITAKAPAEASTAQLNDPEIIAPMVRALLVERFGLAYHTEQRPVSAYSLVAAKPKLKKADPESRSFCRIMPPSPKTPPNSQLLTCQNASMALFAERLLNMAQGLSSPVEDATGLEGGWDFTLSFSPFPPSMLSGPARGPDALAADPVVGYTIFESIEKQLGLKLESQKRSLPVIVIDHLEQKPTDN